MPVRRKEKEVCNPEVMERLLNSAKVIHIAMNDEGEPYIVPMLFGYRDGSIFLHSAKEGRKVEVWRRGGKVCFEVEELGDIQRKELPCKWTLDYVSVIGWGQPHIIEDETSMRKGLDVIMEHYGGRPPFEYSEALLSKTLVVRIDIISMTCKRSISP
ncbi:MAG: pyridoxamine 5'-phosphate oxidase family protein [Methanomassiliicoccales archaeon]